jgi:hypothetical protein
VKIKGVPTLVLRSLLWTMIYFNWTKTDLLLNWTKTDQCVVGSAACVKIDKQM